MSASPNPDLVRVPKHAFIFCRYSVAVLVWLGWLLRAKEAIVAAFAVLALSALLKVRRAPMILLYQHTLGRWVPSAEVELDVRAMRFAHTLGAVFALACVILLYFVRERSGWGLTLLFAIVKTISALGVCPAYKLYGCATSGSCCAFTRRLRS